MLMKTGQKKLIIKKEWCKSCGICVEFCPKDVLVLDNDKVAVLNPGACIGCGLCEMRCPDYAIYFGRECEKDNG